MIAFRVDANEYIAIGHLMRCIAIAIELRKQGKDCIFFLAEPKAIELLEEKEFPYIILQSKWNELEGELPIMEQMIQKYSPQWLLVDSYQVTEKYLRQLNAWVRVMYLDDMADFVYPVSMVLHYADWLEDNSYQKQYVGTNTKVLVGMKFVPLRNEFYPIEKKDKKNINNVLITTGGTDTYNVAGKFLKEVFETEDRMSLQEMIYHVIVGSMNQNKDELKELERKYSNIILHFHVNNMGDMMRKSDFAISAGGTTLFELCACQVPTICFSFADNQEAFARKMEEKQVMLYAGDPRYPHIDIAKNLYEKLVLLKSGDRCIKKLVQNMKLLVDNRGAYRIAKELII